MFCANCGVEAGLNGSFCQSCGKPLNANATSKSPNSLPSPQVNPSEFASGSGQVSPSDEASRNAPKAMKFMEAVKFGYLNYANFKGRASRSQYWYWVLHYWIVSIALTVVSGISLFLASDGTAFPLGSLFFVGIFIPSIACATRRLHDINKSGALMLLGLIPIIGAIILLVWFCTPGDPGANRYGPGGGQTF
jgi:uncharacterized membrane protein YhaH (DUF805 family)